MDGHSFDEDDDDGDTGREMAYFITNARNVLAPMYDHAPDTETLKVQFGKTHFPMRVPSFPVNCNRTSVPFFSGAALNVTTG